MTPARITLERNKGWSKPEGAKVVTRATIWGNPWQAGCPGIINWPNPLRAGFWTQTPYLSRLRAYDFSVPRAVDYFETWLSMNGYHIPQGLTAHGRRVLSNDMAVRRSLILSRLPELRGHDLCCFCKPGEPCHADVLIRLANA